MLVITGGTLYVVDPDAMGVADEVSGSVVDVIALPDRNAVLLSENRFVVSLETGTPSGGAYDGPES